MNREQAKEKIKKDLKCKNFLAASKGKMYCCPLCGSGTHNNGTGALKVYEDTNKWYCNSCKNEKLNKEKLPGDVIDLIKITKGKDDAAAFEYARNLLHITLTGDEKPPVKREEEKKEEVIPPAEEKPIKSDFTAYYNDCNKRLISAEGKPGLLYLQARGISKETACRFNIGFDPEADPAQSNHPTARVIIPTCPQHYVGRAIDAENKYPKLNPIGGKPWLFNGEALTRGATEIFIVEGCFDAISIEEVGGTAIALNSAGNGKILLNELQQHPISKGTNFIVSFDTETDEQKAKHIMQEQADLITGLQEQGYTVYPYNINCGCKDANEALCKDRKAFENTIRTARMLPYQNDLTAFFDTIQTEEYKPHSTGLYFFDDLIGGGVINQTLTLLMAAPATGKTTLAQQIAEAMAQNRHPVLYFNFEMSREQMLAKAISARMTKQGKPITAIEILQGYKWTAEQRTAIAQAVKEYEERNYPFIKYNPAGTSADLDQFTSYLKATGERAKATGEQAPAVICDYLHLLTSRTATDAQELVKQAVLALKGYAKDFNTVAFAIVASNRTSNKDGKLTMESARDSSAIEYTADCQISMNYFDVDNGKVNPSDEAAMAELKGEEYRRLILRVLKGRLVPGGRSAKVYFNAAHNIFYGESDYLPGTADIKPFEKRKAETIKY